MFQAGVFTLGIFTDDSNVDVLQAGGNTRDVLAERKGSIHIEVFAHSDVEGLVAKFGDRSEQGTLDTDLVAAERGKRFLEELVVLGSQTRNIVLFELDGSVGSLEHVLQRSSNLGTNTVTRDKSDSVLAAILFRENLHFVYTAKCILSIPFTVKALTVFCSAGAGEGMEGPASAANERTAVCK